MPTHNPRINVTFEPDTAKALNYLAHQEHKSVAGLVRELALEALEMREDFALSKLAQALDKANVETYPHDEAWK